MVNQFILELIPVLLIQIVTLLLYCFMRLVYFIVMKIMLCLLSQISLWWNVNGCISRPSDVVYNIIISSFYSFNSLWITFKRCSWRSSEVILSSFYGLVSKVMSCVSSVNKRCRRAHRNLDTHNVLLRPQINELPRNAK